MSSPAGAVVRGRAAVAVEARAMGEVAKARVAAAKEAVEAVAAVAVVVAEAATPETGATMAVAAGLPGTCRALLAGTWEAAEGDVW